MRTPLRTLIGLPLAAILTFALSATPAHADAVEEMGVAVRQLLQPTTGASLVTPWASEAAAASGQYGYTTDLGAPFKAATKAGAGLTAVHRLWNAKTVDFTEALAGSSAYQSAMSAGYVDQGIRFYALAAAISGRTEPVNSYVKAGKHRLATAAVGANLVKEGWQLERIAFHAPVTQAVAAPAAPAPAPAPQPAPETGGTSPAASGPGSLPIGKASYPAPSSAIYVSPSGSDSSTGTPTAPVRTIQRALGLAPSGGTVVVRAGTYRETLTITKPVALQNYPGEAVWLDGSSPVTGWVSDGTVWRKDGWTTRFDSSPTYTQGAPDNTAANWRFVDTATYPMAAHPDQVFVDGAPLQQVKSRSLVKEGTFYLDESTSKLYIGTNPAGKSVEASTIVKAINVRAAKSTIRGIGVRRFSPSVFHIGSVTIEQPNVTVENVVVADSATIGLSVLRENVALNQVTITGSGMLGIHGRYADNLKLTKVLSTKNNDERFNIAPTSGGAKIGKTRGVTVSDSSFSGNYGHGFWQDMSVYNTVFRQSQFSDNVGTGLFLEISAKAVVGDNTFARNKEFGIKVNNTSDVKIWNNTFAGNGRPLNIVQDTRRNTTKSDQAVDPRQTWPDPTMPWTLGPVTIRNNIVADSTQAANCLLCVEDYSKQKSAEQMKITANSNIYSRPSSSRPTWLAVWSRADVNPNPYTFTSLAALTAKTGQESKGREYIGTTVLDANLNLTGTPKADQAAIAEALPSDVATAIGRPAGSKVLGRW